ncbi:MAG TPA: 23S rRNA (adenine(2030)-N(6))-methyltransferase RlmJ [Povalibacter sp.]|uniref:23S rRNA (adenine(2030)-N(6))-methyltransferase RlmJ n=1 Tax=Povalibacter sp. TaxID=1962978 RepID=UPI002C42501F|nr:23S rRNA (adenine(2030)-N(6))-methyltransferase RlmJ [Povalibacter sp.]HMN45208.1 23S rRNA (adenine(2030)-N(6))-methyltransferase RlmJ [Povalibacter sp.]
MNYRHAFHAGNFADVHKHVVLLAILARLTRKPTPLFFLDTHAGRGLYDLHSEDAARGNEWREGAGRLHEARPADADLAAYLQIASEASEKTTRQFRQYAGSPLLALRVLRDTDRVVFVEQQPMEARALEKSLPRRRGMSVITGDGYASLKTYLPPKENRGLVLIDPPYEAEDEFAAVEKALRFGLDRWPNGVFAVWYPIKASGEYRRFHASLQQSGLRKLLLLDFHLKPEDSPLGLNGSGLLIANPPWQLDIAMRETLDELLRLLSPDKTGSVRIEWLAGE